MDEQVAGTEIDWAMHLAERRRMGLPITHYCRDRGLKVHQFHYHAAKERERVGGVQTSGFLELKPDSSGLALRRGAWQIELRPGFDPALLRCVVDSLGGL